MTALFVPAGLARIRIAGPDDSTPLSHPQAPFPIGFGSAIRIQARTAPLQGVGAVGAVRLPSLPGSGFEGLLFDRRRFAAGLLVGWLPIAVACSDHNTRLPLHLYDHLEALQIEGVATALLDEVPPAVPRALLALDFEEGGYEPLSPFSGFGPPAVDAAPQVAILEGERAWGQGRSLLLRGGVEHGVSVRSAPIPVSAGERYRLSYRIRTSGLRKGGSKTEFGGASILLYAVPLRDSEAVGELLADPVREKSLRLRPPAEFTVRRLQGTHSWIEQVVDFGTGPRATHMVVSFDLSRPRDDRAAHRAIGRAVFDDILLTATRGPVLARHRVSDEGVGAPHPLKVAVQLAHPARYHAKERRYGIAAPAPSTLSFRAAIPAAAVLDFGYALTTEAQTPGADPVVFAIEVTDAEGGVHELFRDELLPEKATAWSDASVDLTAFAEQTVRVALRTEGRPASASPADDLLRLPEGGAMWSYPILHDPGHRGRVMVLVGIDTLAAGRTSTYGYPVATTPQLTAIAKRGVRFERAISPSPWTLPAFASILTGLEPASHRAGEFVRAQRHWQRPLARAFTTIAERLRVAGWATRGWINNPLMRGSFGIDQGFVSFVDYASQGHDEAAAVGVDAVLSHLAQPRGYDRFLFLHLMDPHGPYRSNDEFRSRFLSGDYAGPFEQPLNARTFGQITGQKVVLDQADRERVTNYYESAVAYTDDQLGRLFQALEAVGRSAEVSLVVISDHGEELWEHGLFEHGHSMNDELLRVPLVLWAPGRAEGGVVVESPVSALDVAPTLLDLAGLEDAGTDVAASLLSHLKGGAPPGDRTLVAQTMLYGIQRLAAERDGVKYVYNQLWNGQATRRSPRPPARHELYLLSEDPGETRNAFPTEHERARTLHEALSRHFVASLGEAYVLRLEGGVDPEGGLHRWGGRVTLPPESALDRFVRDFVWPLPDGREAPVHIKVSKVRGRSQVSFLVEAPLALLAFPVRVGGGPVELDLTLDGAPVDPERVRIGEGYALPGSLPVELDEALLRLKSEDLLGEHSVGEPRALFGRVDEIPELRNEVGEQRFDPDLRRQLEALGYVQE
jgi:arylsulfatase A-like enzyme